MIVGRWAWTFAFAAFSLIGSANDFGTPALAQVQPSGEPSEVSQPHLTGDWVRLRSGEPSEVSQPNLTGDWGGTAVLSRAPWHHFYA